MDAGHRFTHDVELVDVLQRQRIAIGQAEQGVVACAFRRVNAADVAAVAPPDGVGDG